MGKLTARGIDHLPHGRHSDGDGTGLHLLVKKSGSKSWVQRIRIHGKQRDIGHGAYPIVTLAAARALALETKRAVIEGRDPMTEREEANSAARRRLTFSEAAVRAHAELQHTWKNPKDRAAFLSTLSTYAGPFFGNDYIDAVTSAKIRSAILSCRKTRPGVAHKLTYRISSVFKWAMAENLCLLNPAHPASLALPKMERRQANLKSLHYAKVADAIETVNASGAWTSTKLAIEFTILTAARSGEARGARWDEVDLDAAVWTVPAERMKMNREHRVPLSPRAVEVLREAEALRDASGLVFPSVRGKQLSDMTLSKLVREQGINSTVHGFRSSFRTWAHERTNVPGEVAEAALAHVKADKVEAAYARSDLFEKRRKLMESWAAFLSETDAKVARIG